MRSVNRIVFLGRVISSVCSSNSLHRLPQVAPYGTCSNFNSQWLSQKLADLGDLSNLSISRSVARARYSSAATSLAENLNEKGTPGAEKLKPKDVVLYQYEACPFCNKVKGNFHFLLLLYRFRIFRFVV